MRRGRVVTARGFHLLFSGRGAGPQQGFQSGRRSHSRDGGGPGAGRGHSGQVVVPGGLCLRLILQDRSGSGYCFLNCGPGGPTGLSLPQLSMDMEHHVRADHWLSCAPKCTVCNTYTTSWCTLCALQFTASPADVDLPRPDHRQIPAVSCSIHEKLGS